MFAFSRLLSATFVSAVLSSILASADTLPSLDGTQATLVISNQNLSPDGFERPYVLLTSASLTSISLPPS
jgi:hypothetical protein